MVLKNKEFDEIYDLVGVRVMVSRSRTAGPPWAPSTAPGPRCTGRFKDYINTPKFNLYQSLHTTVVGPAGQAPGSPDPHPGDAQPGRAGIAAHWGYKEKDATGATWPGCRGSPVDWSAESTDPAEFLEA